MKNNRDTYNQQVIEIADYIFANPAKKTAEIIAEYCGKLRRGKRTIELYIAGAKKYNKQRINVLEKTKEATEKAIVKLSANKIASRLEVEEILSSIARGEAKKILDDLIIPTPNDQIKAIDKLSAMNGWNAPTKTATTDSDGNDIITKVEVEIKKMC
jgi:flagellar motor switch protein FliG